MDKLFSQRGTLAFVFLLTIWHLYLSACLQLHPDEAYYWLWSRKLDIGYYDHSPLVAYFIWFTTLFSKAEIWVRLSGTIVTLLLSFMTWRLSLQLFGSIRIAAASVMLFNVYPMTTMGMIVMTPDIPLILFSALSIHLFWQALHSDKTWLWYVLGASFGLALLSKYTAILLLPCFFLYLLLTEDRRWLKTIHPYLAAFIGVLFFLPVVYWNSQHDWVSFAFQFGHGLGGQSYSIDRVVDYIAGQLLLVGPLTWLLGIYASAAWIFRKDKRYLFLILTSLPIILFFGLSSLKKLAGPNWPAFAYFTFSILLTKHFLDSPSRVKRLLWYAAFTTSLLLSAIITIHARYTVIPLASFSKEAAIADTTNAFYGWRELGAELKKYPELKFALSHSHQLSAEIAYYTDENIVVQADPGARYSQYNLWPWPGNLRASSSFYVWDHAGAAGPYEKFFSSSPNQDSLIIYRGITAIRAYSIMHIQNSLLSPSSVQR